MTSREATGKQLPVGRGAIPNTPEARARERLARSVNMRSVTRVRRYAEANLMGIPRMALQTV